METISLSAKVWHVIDEIDSNGITPLVDPGNGLLYVLNTSQKELGSILYTVFDGETLYPESSYSVKFSHKHTIGEILFEGSVIRKKLDKIVDLDVPTMPRPEWNPMIIPGCTKTYPTT